MVRAVFFDFYSVWSPDRFAYYQALAQQSSPEVSKQVSDIFENYYHGKVDIDYIADSLRVKLAHPDINVSMFKLSEANVSPEIVNFMRELHGHFLKVGVLANLGKQESEYLSRFNDENQALEVIASPYTFQSESPLLSQEIFAQALQAIGEPLDACLWVSGNFAYLQFAKYLGIQTVQYEGFAQLKTDIEKLIANDLQQ